MSINFESKFNFIVPPEKSFIIKIIIAIIKIEVSFSTIFNYKNDPKHKLAKRLRPFLIVYSMPKRLKNLSSAAKFTLRTSNRLKERIQTAHAKLQSTKVQTLSAI